MTPLKPDRFCRVLLDHVVKRWTMITIKLLVISSKLDRPRKVGSYVESIESMHTQVSLVCVKTESLYNHVYNNT